MKKIRQTMAKKKKRKIIRDKLKDNNEIYLETQKKKMKEKKKHDEKTIKDRAIRYQHTF